MAPDVFTFGTVTKDLSANVIWLDNAVLTRSMLINWYYSAVPYWLGWCEAVGNNTIAGLGCLCFEFSTAVSGQWTNVRTIMVKGMVSRDFLCLVFLK
jgi:hypothetical protein